jgi:transposase
MVGGVDTHCDLNVAAVAIMNGGPLGRRVVPTTAVGHRSLSSWMSAFGTIQRVGVEGTGAYETGPRAEALRRCWSRGEMR